MKTNFKKSKTTSFDTTHKINNMVVDKKKPLTAKEFEDWIHKSGAKGSFMVYRTKKNPDQELGIDEL